MFYYIYEEEKCVGLIKADPKKVKNDAYDNMKISKDYISVDHIQKFNTDNKIKLTLNADRKIIKSNGSEFALITILGNNFDDNKINVFINDEIIELDKLSNKNFIFKLKSNAKIIFNIHVNTEKYYSDILTIKSI